MPLYVATVIRMNKPGHRGHDVYSPNLRQEDASSTVSGTSGRFLGHMRLEYHTRLRLCSSKVRWRRVGNQWHLLKPWLKHSKVYHSLGDQRRT